MVGAIVRRQRWSTSAAGAGASESHRPERRRREAAAAVFAAAGSSVRTSDTGASAHPIRRRAIAEKSHEEEVRS
jgi:hypothetical protein